MPKVIFINAEKQQVSEVTADFKGVQGMVGGYVQLVPFVKNLKGSNLAVDEDGLGKGYSYGFQMDGYEFVGNGVVATLGNSNTKMTAQEIAARVSF